MRSPPFSQPPGYVESGGVPTPRPGPAEPAWSRQPGRPRRGDACPLGICDGSGFTYDLETNTAYDCRCRPQRVALAKARSLSAVTPRRYRDVSSDRPPATDIDVTIVAATRRFSETIDDQLDAGRGLWLMGPGGTGKTTLAMLAS